MPLLAPVEELGVVRVVLRQSGIVDLDALQVADAHALQRLRDPLLAADQDRRAKPLVAPGERRRDALLLLAFREHDPLGLRLDALDDQLHPARGRVEAAAQLLPVALEAEDRPTRDAGLHGGPGDRRRARR